MGCTRCVVREISESKQGRSMTDFKFYFACYLLALSLALSAMRVMGVM
jgi:hypothetical protein